MLFSHKLVGIVNKDIEIGVGLNALAHASLAIGANLGPTTTQLETYKSASGEVWPMSGMPYIILRGKSGEIRKALAAGREHNFTQTAFVETMTGETYVEQLARTAQLKEEEHTYYAAILFGPWDLVSQATKRFSLYK